jgi:hypothetical protein
MHLPSDLSHRQKYATASCVESTVCSLELQPHTVLPVKLTLEEISNYVLGPVPGVDVMAKRSLRGG